MILCPEFESDCYYYDSLTGECMLDGDPCEECETYYYYFGMDDDDWKEMC